MSVKVNIEEKCSILCERDGTLKKFDIQGSLILTITDPDFAKVNVLISTDNTPEGLNFRVISILFIYFSQKNISV